MTDQCANLLFEMGLSPLWRLRQQPADELDICRSDGSLKEAPFLLEEGLVSSCLVCEQLKNDWALKEAQSVNCLVLSDELSLPDAGRYKKLLDAILGSVGLVMGDGAELLALHPCSSVVHETTPVCHVLLKAQIDALAPRLILAIGSGAMKILREEVSDSTAQDAEWRYQNVPIVALHGLKHLLEYPQDKALAWENMCLVRSRGLI